VRASSRGRGAATVPSTASASTSSALSGDRGDQALGAPAGAGSLGAVVEL
jgi:hypothetical protein